MRSPNSGNGTSKLRSPPKGVVTNNGNNNGYNKDDDDKKKLRSPPKRTPSSDSVSVSGSSVSNRGGGNTKIAVLAVLLFSICMSIFAIFQSTMGDLKLSHAVENNVDEISQLPSKLSSSSSAAAAAGTSMSSGSSTLTQRQTSTIDNVAAAAATAVTESTAKKVATSSTTPAAAAAAVTPKQTSQAVANAKTTTTSNNNKKEFPRLTYDNYPSTIDPKYLSHVGLLSKKPSSFFTKIQNDIDNVNPYQRCQKYGYGTKVLDKPRKIFYGAMIADEPWELLEIVAAEVYGVFDTVVFVEGNLTQAHKKREWKKNKPQDLDNLKALFGTDNIIVKEWIKEEKISEFAREQGLRQAILEGWSEMGMTVDDIGYIADTDETFSREFLRVAQTCESISAFNFTKHQCVMQRIGAKTMMFESSPECITSGRVWRHPAMVPGVCLEYVGNETYHYKPNRTDIMTRPKGYGGGCDYSLVDRTKYGNPLFNGADFRNLCCMGPHTSTGNSYTTGFHFHNFFANLNSTRFKYTSYGHHMESAAILPLEMLSNDMKMMYRCMTNQSVDPNGQRWHHVPGGFNRLPFKKGDPVPIYFQDEEYRKAKHEQMVQKVKEDDAINNPINKTKAQRVAYNKEMNRLERNRLRKIEIEEEKKQKAAAAAKQQQEE